MCLPRNPWSFVNEYHTIACGLKRVLYQMEIAEVKDMSSQQPPKAIEKPLWHTAKLVILDSGFWVLKGIVELRKKGVFALALIKKRRYCPKLFQGDEFKAHFAYQEVGAVDACPGQMDSFKFHVICMK